MLRTPNRPIPMPVAVSAVAVAAALGGSRVTQLSLAPKSVTTPIAMGSAERIGGLPSLTAVLVISTGILGAIGAAVAGAHPASIASAFIASPLTPLHPALASGMVSGAVELWARKPRVGDFQRLRDDVTSLRGWWRNRVARVFLVFFLTSLGTAIGVWVAGFRMAAKLAG